MLKTNHIDNRRDVGGDYFKLLYIRKCNMTLQEHLNNFNKEEYWILKSTGNQRLVTYDDMITFKYSNYILFKKDKYDINIILEWCDFIKPIQYLDKPTPPFSPTKIIIKN